LKRHQRATGESGSNAVALSSVGRGGRGLVAPCRCLLSGTRRVIRSENTARKPRSALGML
jgi:hypothetical protein